MRTPQTSNKRTLLAMSATAVSAAFLLGGYDFVRVAADSLFIGAYGAAQRPHAMALSAAATAAFVYVFGRLLSRFGSLGALVLSFAIALCVFAASFLAVSSGKKSGVLVLYLFGQSYIVILFEQYWSFINSILKKEEARAYNGPIIGVASAGAVAAGWLINRTAVSVGTKTFILLGAAAMLPSLALIYAAYRLAGEPLPSEQEKKARGGALQLSLFRKHRALVWLALVIALSQGLSAVVELNFIAAVEKTIPLQDARTAFMGSFWMTVSGAACVFQFFAAPLLLKLFSLRAAMAAIPCAHLLLGLFMFGSDSLAVAALAYGGFKTLDYSLFRAGKEIIYIPFSFNVRYRAKQVIDAVVYRFSKGLFSGLISMYTVALGAFPRLGYPLADVAISLGWLAAVFPLTRNTDRPAV